MLEYRQRMDRLLRNRQGMTRCMKRWVTEKEWCDKVGSVWDRVVWLRCVLQGVY